METAVINVTPEIAAEWLNANTINRPLRRTVVDGYKAALARGEYRLTHQGIAFAVTGELIDGQHRLTAISEMPANFTLPIMVTRGLPLEANKGIDQGLKRSHSDVLEVPPGLAAVARYMATICETTRSGITSQFLIPFINGSRDAYNELVSFCPKHTRTWSSAAVRCAAILQMLNKGDTDYIKVTYYALNHAEFDSMSPAAQALYRQHVSGKTNSHGYDMFCRSLKAFDTHSQSMNKLQINDPSGVLQLTRDIVTLRVLGKPLLPPAKKPQKAKQKAYA